MAASSASSSLHSSLGMSVHSDILSAEIPSDPSSKQSLITELKSRARVSIQSRQYPVAELLYDKAIDVVKDSDDHERESAILFSNRSLVKLQMNKLEESLKDADRATELDRRYVKGFWRKGQALSALCRYKEAVEALKEAVVMDPKNKALMKEVEKCRTLQEKQEEAKNNIVEEEKKEEKQKSTKIMKENTTSDANSEKKNISPKKVDLKGSEFSKSDHVRGYKIVDGKKTSFFHHEQTEEEKRLIGDIAPKRLDPSAIMADQSSNTSTPTTSSLPQSAWNKAGTWEEKDVTQWAKEQLSAQCLLAQYELPASSPSPGSVASVTSIKKIHGHASVATARGKRRFIYEFAITLEWEMTLPNEDNTATNNNKAKGTMTFPDIDGTCEKGDYEMGEYKVDTTETPPSARHLLDRFVRNGGLRDDIVKRMDEWVECLKSTYA